MRDPIEVLISVPFGEELVEPLRDISPLLRMRVSPANTKEEILPEDWATVEVLYTRSIVPDSKMAPNLRWIQFHWAGINHVVNAPILHEQEVVATTLSGANATQMAEYILMMLLALGHKLPDLIAHQRQVLWPNDRWTRFSPRELRESVVGIVGYGSIGRQVARLLHPFGTKVLATKRNAMQPADDGYMPEGYGDPKGDYVHRLYPSEALKSMVKECDFIIITVPLSKSTINLVDASVFEVMKPEVFLIDVSRGGVVNQGDLIEALRNDKLGGAALDVFPIEPLPSDNVLWKFPNVVITPHISGNTPNYDQRAVALFAENLKRYISGEPLFNQFNPELGY